MILICLLFLKLALTPEQQELGLMGVSALPDNEAMLFVYPKAQKQCFWSFGCLISLDVGFLDEKLVLREVAHLPCHPAWQSRPPITTHKQLVQQRESRGPAYTVCSQSAYRYIIELPAGWFARQKVAPGAKLIINKDSTAYFEP